MTSTPPAQMTIARSDDTGRDGGSPIVYFDGVCGLCDRSVNWMIARDRHQVFRFAPLQGETAAARLPLSDRQNLGSMVLEMEGGTYRRSSAVVRILWRLGGANRILGSMLWVIPRPLRDLGYRLVASNRYRLFGKHETCRMLSPEERARFLP